MGDLFQNIGALYSRFVDTGESYNDGLTVHNVYAQVAEVRDDIYYTRKEQTWRCWFNDFVPGAAERVLDSMAETPTGGSGICFPLVEGRDYYISQMWYALSTDSGDCRFTIGYTSGSAGDGTFTPLTGAHRMFTGAAIAGWSEGNVIFGPPIKVSYSDGARAITYRVDANDGACSIACGHAGWWETEP